MRWVASESAPLALPQAPAPVLFLPALTPPRKPGLAALFGALLPLALFPLSAPAGALDPSLPLTQAIHHSWQVAQGLPQNSVLGFAQTPDGYLWFGTEEGLVRFDGVRFTVFDKHNSGLTNNEVTALLVDHTGTLWLGSADGSLVRFSANKFTAFTTRNGLSTKSITSLFEDAHGALWIATDGAGVLQFDRGKIRSFTKADGLADNAVFSISGSPPIMASANTPPAPSPPSPPRTAWQVTSCALSVPIAAAMSGWAATPMASAASTRAS